MLPSGLRQADASRIARLPSGHDLRVPFASCWVSAATAPATAGAAMLVPERFSPTAAHRVPFAEISGSSRSPCEDDGLRKHVSDARPEAVSLWLATVRRL